MIDHAQFLSIIIDHSHLALSIDKREPQALLLPPLLEAWQLEPIQSTYGQEGGPRGRKTLTGSYEAIQRASTKFKYI